LLGLREREMRPIPSIAVMAIELLQHMQRSLRVLGLLDKAATLFQPPLISGSIRGKAEYTAIYGAVDLFCDYIQLDTDEQGRRYYLRSHQLRRSFAMVFFWHAGYGQMDTLRWFLGQTDIEHLYRYITESTPGQVLRTIKADFAVERMTAGDDAAQALAEVVLKNFGVESVSLLDQAEMAEYVEALLRDGITTIEPIFFDDGANRAFRVAIKVVPGGLNCQSTPE